MKYACESAQRDTRTCWAWRQHLLWFVGPKHFRLARAGLLDQLVEYEPLLIG
jgi:hypothetical protein